MEIMSSNSVSVLFLLTLCVVIINKTNADLGKHQKSYDCMLTNCNGAEAYCVVLRDYNIQNYSLEKCKNELDLQTLGSENPAINYCNLINMDDSDFIGSRYGVSYRSHMNIHAKDCKIKKKHSFCKAVNKNVST